MHGLIRERLEDYLSGAPGRKIPLEVEQHLQHCEQCREELSWMQEQSRLLRTLSASREHDPAPGFYARVMDRVERQQTSNVWTAFLDPIFGRRLAATAVAMLALIIGVLAYSERTVPEEESATQATEAIMANDPHPPLGVDRQRDRATVFVTLATYRE